MRWSSKCLCAGQQEQASRRRILDGECTGRKAGVVVYQLWRLNVVGGRVEGLRRRLRGGRRTGNVQGNMTPRRLRLRCGRWRIGLLSDNFAPAMVRHLRLAGTAREEHNTCVAFASQGGDYCVSGENADLLCTFLRHVVYSTPPKTLPTVCSCSPIQAPRQGRDRLISNLCLSVYFIPIWAFVIGFLPGISSRRQSLESTIHLSIDNTLEEKT